MNWNNTRVERRHRASTVGFSIARTDSRSFVNAAIVLVVAFVLALVGVGTAPVAPASAAPVTNSCHYGSGGTQATGLCWLDFTGYLDSEALSSAGQQFTQQLPGGFTMTYTVNRVATGGSPAVAAVATPTWSGTPFGNSASGGQYKGIAGKPALYAQGVFNSTLNSGSWTISLKNIQVRDSAGALMTGWTLNVADAESTNRSERLTFITNGGGWQIVNSIPPLSGPSPGPGCAGGLTGQGTSNLVCTGSSSVATVGDIVASTGAAPTQISATAEQNYSQIVGAGGQSGVAFAISTATIALNKSVAGRVLPTDQFGLSLKDAPGTQLGSSTTSGSQMSATTGAITVLPGSSYELSESAAGTSNFALYGQSWSCSNANTGSSSTLPITGAGGISQSVTPAPGDEITCTITNTPASYTVEKIASSASVAPGGTLIYTVTVKNTGPVAYTITNPASFTDNLSAVLDDATYNGDASNGATVNGNTLSWSGALPIGGTVTVTYSVTVGNPVAGNKILTNAVTPTGPGGTCAIGGQCQTSTPVGSLTYQKSVDHQSALPGDTVKYTVTVTNTGQFAYTTATPASISDDLSDVLDDATYNGDASSGATVAGTTLNWSGALPVGGTVTITYSVTVNDPDTGNHLLVNTVTSVTPGSVCATPGGCETTTPVAGYTVVKTASASSSQPGDTVTYTLTVKNTGQVAYTTANPATLTDDLSAVLDDALYNGDASSGATVSGNTLSWSGALPIGGTVTITYSVTIKNPDTGDHVMTNTVTPTGPGGDCPTPGDCTTTTPIRSLHVTKTTTVTEVTPGEVVPYTIQITNTGQVAYTAGDPASITDDLSDVLDDATYNNDLASSSGADASYAAPVISWSGPLGIGETITLTYSVTVNNPDTGDHHLVNTVVGPPGSNCPPSSNDPDCNATVPSGSFTVAKTASRTTAVPGDVVTYTVTVHNTGAIAYTAQDPASFTDDLSDVLDDATYNGDADNGATVTGTSLNWSGALPVDATVTITYSVTINSPDTGNQTLTNAVRPTSPGGDCVTPGGCETTTPVASYTVHKDASASTANPGDMITYTVTVTNTGAVAYTAASPATFTDDLTAVLDDATYNGDASSGATMTGNTLSWSGALPVGGTVTVTYSVTVNNPDTGDHVLTNTVVPTAPGGDCTTPGGCTTTTPVSGYSVAKTASSTSAQPGDAITYTVTVTNTGEVAYTTTNPASLTDDLSAVLDDATYNNDADNGATVTGATLNWAGALPVGGTVTITYSVTVNNPDTGDHVLTNAVVPTAPGGDCPTPGGCTTTTPVASYTVAKSASATSAQPGDTVTYTVVVTNTSDVAYTTAKPASFTDDLTAVLDDATYNGDATNGAVVAGNTLSWSGALAAHATVTITYSVTVKNPDTGDHALTNAVVPTAPGGDCTAPGGCTTTTPIASYTVAKTASATTAALGDTITYTVTVTNTSGVAYTNAAPASFTDDLSAVLDDATYNGDADNGATVTGSTLSWSGALPPNGTVTITYSVTVNNPDTGDHVLTNAVVPTGPGGDCVTPGGCETTTPVASYTVGKMASQVSALPGDTVTYTITVTNTGEVAYTDAAPASLTDDLSAVLDDATYNGDANNGASVTGSTLNWSGALPIGGTVTITYTVIVNNPDTGDHVLTNAVVPTGPGGDCVTPGGCETTTPVASYTVGKTASASTATPGDVITYTVTVTNTGQVAYTTTPASFTDDLSKVLDDATYNGDASNGATVIGTTLSWSGALPIGGTVTITYSVTVDDPDTGDHVLTNAVVPTGPGGGCVTPGGCETTTPVASLHVVKTTTATEVTPGEVVPYTIQVTNTGQVAYTDTNPASFTDDLSSVLDDATYNNDAASSSGAGVSYNAPVISWSGPLDVGATVTITYSVTVNDPDTGDHQLSNTVVAPPGSNCPPGSDDPDCNANVPSASFTVAKTASATTALPGDTITYTITVKNTGNVDYSSASPASFTDDLSRVLDDATYNGDATNGATVNGATLSWAGALPVGATVQITYSVTVTTPDIGDHLLTNAVVPTAPGGGCDIDGTCTTTTPVAGYTVAKSVNTMVSQPGQKVTYTITVTNTGQVPYTSEHPATLTDDLSKVLDDATYNGDASAGATVSGSTLTWAGALPVGATVQITYSVTVKSPVTGDHQLANTVTPTDPSGNCTAPDACQTTTPVLGYSVHKTASAAAATPGQTITYRIEVTNTGTADYTTANPASFTDDLSNALKLADYNGDADQGAVYSAPVLSWSGALPVGGTVTVSYSMTVKAGASGKVTNVVVTPPGAGSNCPPNADDPDCTAVTTVTPPPVGAAVHTGGYLVGPGIPAWTLMGAAWILLIAAATTGVLLIRRRRSPNRNS